MPKISMMDMFGDLKYFVI